MAIRITIRGRNPEGYSVEYSAHDEEKGAKFAGLYGNLLAAVKRDGISPSAAVAPSSAPAGQQQSPDTQKFTAETLNASMKDGKTYWKVLGGPFRRHGVNLWPEVAGRAGIPVKGKDKEMEIDLDPRNSYDLNVSVEVSMKQSPSDETKMIPVKVVQMADVKHKFGVPK